MAKTLTLADLLKLQFSTLDSLSDETLARLAPVLERAHNEIRNDLDRVAVNKFTYIQKRHTEILLNNALTKLYNRNAAEMYGMAEQMNIFGAEMANEEIKDFQKQVGLSVPNVKKDVLSLDTNDYLINTMNSSLVEYSVGIRTQIAGLVRDAVIQKKTGYETVGRIGKFINLKRWKIYRIVRTEMLKIFNGTKHIAYGEFNKKNFGGTLMKRMFHPMDNRTAEDSKEWAKADPAIPMNQPFRLKLSDGTIQEGMYPPLRPNDRAVLMPFHKNWRE